MSTNTSKIVIVPEPDLFDGTAKNFDHWLMQFEVYFTIHHAKFTDQKVRAITVLSRMKGGSAGLWTKRMIDEKITLSSESWPSWDEFKNLLKATFQDHTAMQKARDKLEYLQQGEKHTIEAFFVLFNTLCNECKLTDDDQCIYLMERTVRRKYIDQIVTMQNRPTVYKDYKDLVLRIARYHKQSDKQLCFERRRTHFFSKTPKTDKPHLQPPPTQEKRTGTGITFRGQGKVMDVDAVQQQNHCFNCGKVGHFKHDCPDPPKAKFNARALVLDLLDEEKRELVNQILLDSKENTEQVFESVNI